MSTRTLPPQAPHILTCLDPVSSDGAIAVTRPASMDHLLAVTLSGVGTGHGRSEWVWIRLANEELSLAVFPQGDTYEKLQEHAAHWGGDVRIHKTGGEGVPEGGAIASVHPASEESVERVTMQGVSEGLITDWQWIRLENGDLAVGVFIPEELYPDVAQDAAWPGLPDDTPEPGL